jgi:Cu(I)/Ag(I) efflux system membrane fusion protein
MNIREGMYVERDVDVMTLADLASVWVVVDVFEQQATWVGKGDKAEVRVTSIADRVWEGWVEYIYPDIDPKTRTLRVRLRFANAGIELKPNMYAQATLFTQPREALSVPRDAIIRSEAGERVIMSKGNGRFQPVTVRTGIESGERTEILEGLTDGDAVVVSAQFLIDSEASLKATLRRIVSPTLPLTSKPQMDLYEATGEVKSVDASAHKLTLTHEPIPALGWPAMTMDFIAAKEVALAALKPGMRVKFTLRKQDPVTYEITSLQQAGGGDL